MTKFLVYPYSILHPTGGYKPGKNYTMAGGVYERDADNSFVPIEVALEKMHGQNCQRPYTDLELSQFKTRAVHGRCFFGGILSFHYGHFLTQSLSRIRKFSPDRHDYIIFSHLYNRKTDLDPQLPGYVVSIFSLLGIPLDRIVFASSQAISCDYLETTPSSWSIPNHIDPSHPSDLADRVSVSLQKLPQDSRVSILPRKRNVLLSRSKYHKGLCAGEVQLERLMFKCGFSVLHPEDLSIEETINSLTGADTVIGVSSSALHVLLLLPQCPKRMIIIHRGLNGGPGLVVQRALNKARNTATEEISAIIAQDSIGTNSMALLDLPGLARHLFDLDCITQESMSLIDQPSAEREYSDLQLYKYCQDNLRTAGFSPNETHLEALYRLSNERLSLGIHRIYIETLLIMNQKAVALEALYRSMILFSRHPSLLMIYKRLIDSEYE